MTPASGSEAVVSPAPPQVYAEDIPDGMHVVPADIKRTKSGAIKRKPGPKVSRVVKSLSMNNSSGSLRANRDSGHAGISVVSKNQSASTPGMFIPS